MSSNLKVLETDRERSIKSVIETLEEALSQAREGKVVAVGVALVRPQQSVNASFSETDAGPALLGGIELLRSRVLVALEDD